MDIYYKNLKFGFTTTPLHNKYFRYNRLPDIEADFPIKLPANPNEYQFMEIDNTYESAYAFLLQIKDDFLESNEERINK